MTTIKDAIQQLLQRTDLDSALMERSMEAILNGEATEAQIAALAVGLRMKGETAAEIAAATRIMRSRCERVQIQVSGPLLDTCGTGGDGGHTVNVSTLAAILVAACGGTVAKHGNRAVSSRCGSADLLEALGLNIQLTPQQVADCVYELGIGFLFAPSHHGALKHAAPVRSQLGVRTFFNVLGPLSNPASATHQLLGVYDARLLRLMAETLQLLGTTKAWVVHGEGNLDEVSPLGTTHVAALENGTIREFELTPKDFGFSSVSMEALRGGDPTFNAEIGRSILAGKANEAAQAVIMNAAAALCVVDLARSPAEGAILAKHAIQSGAAQQKLEDWVQWSRRI